MPKQFKTIGLFGKYKDPGVRDAINSLAEYLRYRNIEVLVGETTAQEIRTALAADASDEDIEHRIDLSIVVGGDGTMLHVARSLAPYSVPLVGVNMGRLGFLTDISLNEMHEDIGRILDGEYEIEQRMMVNAEVIRNDEVIYSDNAFNDMVIGKSDMERLIEIQTYVDGDFVTKLRADGIIVATPTGSTAYALSAGGPIMHPQLEALIMVPICPHMLSQRPIALRASSIIDFNLINICERCAYVSLDGKIVFHLDGDEKIRVRRSQETVNFVRTLDHDHYAALRSKLGWGEAI